MNKKTPYQSSGKQTRLTTATFIFHLKKGKQSLFDLVCYKNAEPCGYLLDCLYVITAEFFYQSTIELVPS